MEERQVRTGIDRFLDLVNTAKELKLADASKKLGVPEATLETWADILLKENLIEIGYDGFGKMVVRKTLVKRQELEGPISEIPQSATPKPAEHKLSLRERLSGMRSKNGHKLLKKYSGARRGINAPDPEKNRSIVSRFLTFFKGSFKKSGASESLHGSQPASVNKIRMPVVGNKSAGAPANRANIRNRARKKSNARQKKATRRG